MFHTDTGEDNDPTRQSLSQIARLHTWPDRFVLHRIVVVAYAVYRLVASFAEPSTGETIRQRRSDAR